MATISLNAKRYTVAREKNQENGALLYGWTARPSQPSDPTAVGHAEWRLDGPALNSYEDTIFGGGILSTDYNDNTDGRWSDRLMLAPAFTSIDCGANDSSDTVQDAHDSAVATSAGGNKFLYVIRGTRLAKLLVSATTLANETNSIQFGGGAAASVATSIIATKAANGNQEVSIALNSGAYRVITTIANTTVADTESANNEAKTVRIFGQADDRVIGLGGSGDERRIAGNILTGSVTMDASAWADIADLDGPQSLQMTGFAMDRHLLVVGTSKGPYILNQRFGRFFPVREDIAYNTENARHMRTWFDPVNLSIPLIDSTRRQLNGSSDSWGIEKFARNTSPLQGYPTGQDGTGRWFRQAIYDVVTDDTWIVDWRPGRGDDPEPDHVMQPFPVGHFTDTGVRFVRWLDTVDSTMTNPHWVIGYNDDVAIQRAGRSAYLSNEYSDANYLFQTSGSWHGTDMRRQDNIIKDFEYVELTTESGCDASNTVTIAFSTNGGTSYTSLSGTLTYTGGATLNGVVDTNGYQRVLFIDNSAVPLAAATGRTFKPRLTFAASAATASPIIRGKLRLTYRARPVLIREYRFSLFIEARERSTREVKADLFTEFGSGPVKLDAEFDGAAVYVRVEDVQVAHSGANDTMVAAIRATEWITTE